MNDNRKTDGQGMKGAVGSFLTILLGLVLIVALTPLTQFLTLGLNNSDLETASPVGWAVGIIVSLVLVLAVCRLISHFRLVSRKSIVLLYCMLTIAVPMMNMGMARALLCSATAVPEHFLRHSVNTYRTAYVAEKPAWFPVVPTLEGLAWNKADRLLGMLQDRRARKRREKAQRGLIEALHLIVRRAQRDADGEYTVPPDETARLRDLILKLGPNEVAAVVKATDSKTGHGDDPGAGAEGNPLRAALVKAGLVKVLEERKAETVRQGAAALDSLKADLADIGEHETAYADEVFSSIAIESRARFERDLERLTQEERAELDRRRAHVNERFADLRAAVTRLSKADYNALRDARARQYMEALGRLDTEQLARVRASFIYRSSRPERMAMYKQDGRLGTPNQNLFGMSNTLWVDPEARRSVVGLSALEKWKRAARGLPWVLWRGPVLHWCALVTLIFGFLMCMAEWLRRKWVDRENLAFPVVEVVDSVIRHDYELETAEDVRDPRPRKRLFTPVFWIGFGVGALFLLLEALGHYGLNSQRYLVSFDVSKNIFTGGLFRNIDYMYFVLSPIVVGLFFLVSLEVSFSVWVIYFIYRFVFVVISFAYTSSTGQGIRDDLYTGWGGGVRFPFNGEQLLGASITLGIVALYRTWHTLHSSKSGESSVGTQVTGYVPNSLTRTGLVALPLLIGWMLWDMGIHNIGLILIFGIFSFLLTIASARVRAETGLPGSHASYEFTKIPLVFGLTRWLGGRVYTLFVSLAFLPVTLLFRLLAQQLEGIELARRNRVKYSTVAIGSLLAFVVALVTGVLSLLVMCYFKGAAAYGGGDTLGRASNVISAYPLWVSHFLGESGLEQIGSQVHWIRIWFIVVGALIFGILLVCRQRFMKFPLNPIGYILILLSTFFPYVQPYIKVPTADSSGPETSWLWGSAFLAWLIKKMIVKYGGMNTYKKVKPLFVGMVVGAIMMVFLWNSVDLVVSLRDENRAENEVPPEHVKPFVENPAFNPLAY